MFWFKLTGAITRWNFQAIWLIIVLFTNWNSESEKLAEKLSFAQQKKKMEKKEWELVCERRDCFFDDNSLAYKRSHRFIEILNQFN